VLPAKLE